jgi:hypothetical protein
LRRRLNLFTLLYIRKIPLSDRDLTSFVICFILIASVMISNNYLRSAYSQTTCSNLPISAVTASSAQSGNPASSAIDNKLDTRWSNEGTGSWITLDLGSQKTVCRVDIGWYKGNERVNSFDIHVSNDGSSFTKIFSDQSSGTTTSIEKYDVSDTKARYLRITFTGNDVNNWASITEIDIFGSSTGSDTTQPTVTGMSPAGGTSNIQVNSVIKVMFSEPMLSSSISTSTFILRIADTPTKLGGAVSLSSDGKTATFEPSANLATSTRYVATIFTGAMDLAGNALSQSKKWSFTTVAASTGSDTTQPTVTGMSPAGGTSNIQVNSVIKVMFSEPMLSSSISTSTFILRIADTPTKLGGAVSLSSDGKTATFEPSANLATSTRYVATIFTGAMDLAGNALSQSKKWSFTTVAASTSGGTDEFGIKKIYSTKSEGEQWYMDMNNPTADKRFNPQNTISKNSDGSWKMKSSKVRMGVYTSSGYSSDKIPTLDHSKIASKGYMLAANDWKNVEMTMYAKVNSAGSDDNFAPYTRGGRHTGGGAPEGCEGSAYKGDLFFSGRVRFAKEQWHVSYVFTDYKSGTSSIKGKWVGFKFMMYNFVDNGKTVVKMELWLDKNNDGTFVKVDENVDRGGWGNEGRECNGAPDQIITWGGPIATFRWDTATDVDFKNLSVREIKPPK